MDLGGGLILVAHVTGVVHPSLTIVILNLYNIGVAAILLGADTCGEYLAGQDDSEPFNPSEFKNLRMWATIVGLVVLTNYAMAATFVGVGLVIGFLGSASLGSPHLCWPQESS
ncbi:MAG: hypothetical protein ACTSPE_13305 [Candidatus Thorarchaeota archaeon]